MSKKRRKKKEEEKISDAWLLPYADLLTLLLALFIVLFSMSAIDASKFQAMSSAFNQLLSGGTGFFEFPSTVPQEEGQRIDDEKGALDDKKSDKLTEVMKEQMELAQIEEKVNTYIEEKNLTDRLETSLTDEGLMLTIRDNVLFDSGSADIKEENVQTAREIAELLVMDPPRNIIISGHTDNVPIRNAEFESNWELSAMRAINFMKIVLQNEKLDPRWFSTKGYGEFKPIAPNDTEEGRAKNRRVEILIEPRTAED